MGWQPVTTADPGSPEWLQARKSGIGASDISVILGTAKWGTPYKLWKAKQPDSVEEPSTVMMMGHALERLVLDCFEDQRNVVLARPPDSVPSIVKWSDDPIVMASLDAYDINTGEPVDAKTTGYAGTTPRQYVEQVMWQAGIMGADRGWLAWLNRTTGDTWIEPIETDWLWFDMAVGAAREWWERHIVGEEPPQLTARDGQPTYEVHPDSVARIPKRLWDSYIAAKEEAEATKRLADDLKVEIQQRVKGATSIHVKEIGQVATWNQVAGRTTIDSKLLREEYPDVFDVVSRKGKPSRRWTDK